jgi:tetratricopeptide (TPR) repeat protein
VAPDRHGVRDDLFATLPSAIPTLASLLSEQGYHTAAFPNSSFLGFSSGLLDGFADVDAPPPVPMSPARWMPSVRPAEETAEHFEAWLETLPGEARYFAWVHFSEPLLAHLAGGALKREQREEGGTLTSRDEAADLAKRHETLESFDAALGQLLDSLEQRGDSERAAVIVAGTLGDVGGGEHEPRGPGFSLHDRVVRVPVVVRFPSDRSVARPPDRPVWAPDVAATLAELGGVRLSGQAEGLSLFEDPAEDRILFSWSWAPLDQMGWRPLRAARSGPFKRLEGHESATIALEGSSGEPEAHVEERLIRALATRADPRAPSVPLEAIQDVLKQRGVELGPAPPEGRLIESVEDRVRIVRSVWDARRAVRRGHMSAAMTRYGRALKWDPDNLAALLDRGHLMSIRPRERALVPLGRAVELHPQNPEVLHWYAHAIWTQSWEEAEQLLSAILPYKAQDSDVLYDLACTRSLAGDLAASEEHLRAAIDAGYREWHHMESDSDLRNLRESGRFAELMREVRQ